jgi:hypothetical protein
MTSTTTVDFSKVNNIYANGTKLNNLWYKTRNPNTGAETAAKLLWNWSTTGTITVTLSFNSYMNNAMDYISKTWEVPAGYTWQDVITKKLMAGTANNLSFKLFSTSDGSGGSVVFQYGIQQYWLVREGGPRFTSLTETLIKGATYYLVKRTFSEAGDEVKYSPLSLGDNEIVIKADEPNFYFFAKEAGTYVFKASSNNAFLGYEEKKYSDEGEEYFEATWVDGISFELEAEEGEVLYICCSNQDFSNETYTLNVSKK